MDFREQLRRQISFLGSSSNAFDAGHIEEALRIAVSLRVLIHDTPNSTSLLTHLDIKNGAKLLSTFEPIKQEPGLLVASIPIWVDSTGNRTPPLGDSYFKEFISIKAWWGQVVMTGNNSLSRQDIILAAANQDGGAHVAAEPGRKTQELIRGVGTHTTRVGDVVQRRVLHNHHFYLIRQFAYEVLESPDLLSSAQ